MADRELISEREERRALGLAARQPASAGKLAELLATLGKRVAAAALEDRKVRRRLVGTRYRVIGVGYAEEKPSGRAREPVRLAEVGFYDYDRDVLVVAVVKPRTGAVVRLEERRGIQPAPSDEEIERARELALSERQLAHLRRRRGLRISALPARAPDDEHRRLHVSFWSGGRRAQPLGEAIVDLSADRTFSATPEEGR